MSGDRGPALSADDAPVWLKLEADPDASILVRPLAATEVAAVEASVERPHFLGYALAAERDGIGAGLCERDRERAQLAWFRALSEAHRAALLGAQTYPMRRLRAWVDAAVIGVRVDGADLPLSFGAVLDAITDTGLLVGLLVEAAGLAEEMSRLGKDGPMCSGRQSGPPTGSLPDGHVSGAPLPSAAAGVTAGEPSPTTHPPHEAPTGSSSGTGGAA